MKHYERCNAQLEKILFAIEQVERAEKEGFDKVVLWLDRKREQAHDDLLMAEKEDDEI